ncbi:MAG: tRNA lysidine(34) synthetase TilS [Ruminococcaceae bacterium]|nr:tRNA lysidine(34) synthetase TilS [Oscillospiraceae bacterium]
MAFKTVLTNIKKAIESFSLLDNGDSVLVGFSGGKDSIILLYSLKELSKEYNIKLTALHVNHNIRGSEAKRDETFCKEFCEKYNVDFICKSVDAVEYSKIKKIGLEEAARILRYQAFEEAAREIGITKIATAHTSSDNLETILFNVIRGASTEGLKGIAPKRNNIIRPLIYCSTEDILSAADELQLSYVTDSTNSDTEYTRNNIRHNIVPLIKKINPNAEASFSSLADSIMTDIDYMSGVANKVQTVNPKELVKLHRSILCRVLIRLYKETGSKTQLCSVHINDMVKLLKSYADSDCREVKRLSLPDKINFVITYDKIYFERPSIQTVLGEHTLEYGLNELDNTGAAIFISDNENEIESVIQKNIYKISTHTMLKKSAINDTIIARHRQDGDVFCFSNMTKKVKKMLNEAKIPVSDRETLPMLCDNRGIFWIPGFPLRDDLKPDTTDKTTYFYYLKRGN